MEGRLEAEKKPQTPVCMSPQKPLSRQMIPKSYNILGYGRVVQITGLTVQIFFGRQNYTQEFNLLTLLFKCISNVHNPPHQT